MCVKEWRYVNFKDNLFDLNWLICLIQVAYNMVMFKLLWCFYVDFGFILLSDFLKVSAKLFIQSCICNYH